MASKYEAARLANIRRNDQVMQSLGLLNAPFNTKKRKKSATKAPGTLLRRKKVRSHANTIPAREKLPRACNTSASKEAANSSSSACSLPLSLPSTRIPDWALRAFAEECAVETTCGCQWDKTHHHQHLTISPSKLMVATTGCAGYGVALSTPRKLEKGAAFFEVHAKSFGCGGFSVGIARSPAWRGPYKSLGRVASSAPDAAALGGAYHSSGYLLTHAHPTADKILSASISRWGDTFQPGDRIGVLVQEKRGNGPPATSTQTKRKPESMSTKAGASVDIHFFLNGKRTGTPIEIETPSPYIVGGIALAVQPYMGGVAQILQSGQSAPYA